MGSRILLRKTRRYINYVIIIFNYYCNFFAGMGAGLGTGFAGMSAAAVISLCSLHF